MVSKALDKSKNTAKVRFFDALSLAFAMSFNIWMTGWIVLCDFPKSVLVLIEDIFSLQKV